MPRLKISTTLSRAAGRFEAGAHHLKKFYAGKLVRGYREYARYDSPSANAFCALGMIVRVSRPKRNEGPYWTRAGEFLGQFLGGSVLTCNDHPARTKEEVIAALRAAAAKAKEQGL